MLAHEMLTADLTEAQQAVRQTLLEALQAATMQWIEPTRQAAVPPDVFAPLLQAVLEWAGAMVGLIGAFEAWEPEGPSVEAVARYFKHSLPTLMRAVRTANGLPPEPWGRSRPAPEEDTP
jgi:hypothetical protein